MKTNAFHLSLPCYDIVETGIFYVDKLGFERGRSAETWVDINMNGNQLTFLKALRWRFPDKYYQFEGQVLPSFHFGILLDEVSWAEQYASCLNEGLVNDDPITFLESKPGEHKSFFIEDPNEYIIEFKTFLKPEGIFK